MIFFNIFKMKDRFNLIYLRFCISIKKSALKKYMLSQ
jgi:hypothetical protein